MRPLRLAFAPRAQTDIAEIHDWFADKSATAATAVISAIRDTVELIGEYPLIGRNSDIEGIKILPVVKYRYLVYYMIEQDDVVIAHIRHGARAAPSPDELKVSP